MPYTHRVRRPWTGFPAGTLIDIRSDPKGWRNAGLLEKQRYIEPISPVEAASLGEPPAPSTNGQTAPTGFVETTQPGATNRSFAPDPPPPPPETPTPADQKPARMPNEAESRDDAEERRRAAEQQPRATGVPNAPKRRLPE